MVTQLHGEGLAVSFSHREVTACGGVALLKQMLDSLGFRPTASGSGLPEPGSNREYRPVQLIEQFIVSIWCGARRFALAEAVRMDSTLVRLCGWTPAAGHKAIMRLFGRFDMLMNVVAVRLTQPLQRALYQVSGGWALEPGLKLTELRYQAAGWARQRRLIEVRRSVKRKTAPGKTLSLFADDPDIQGWRYGAFVTTLELPMVEVWRIYRGRADCENRFKELKADFGLDAFNMRDFGATEAALGFARLAYNLISLFRQAVLRTRVQHTLSTLHSPVLAIGGSWYLNARHNTLISPCLAENAPGSRGSGLTPPLPQTSN